MTAIPESLVQKRRIGGRQILFFNNLEAYLAGVYPDVQKLDGAQGDRSRADKADFRPRMEFLAGNSNNFFRHWVTFYPNFVNGPDPSYFKPDCMQKEPSRSLTSGGEPWAKRYSPFLYTDEGKSDLFRFNEDYFFRLRRMIETALEFGIIVQLTIFDRTGLSLQDCSRWPFSPWNAHNNVNEVINTAADNSEFGVDKFYQRDLPGKVRVPRVHPIHPGEGGDGEVDPDDFVERPTTLGALQDKYAQKVVGDTMKYPNVVYEIMNEPFGGGQVGDVPARVKWNDTMLGVIYALTQGKRLVFYNELTRGDVALWRKSTTTANYSKLDGVTFHGDAKNFDPNGLGQGILSELIVQVSTDTYVPKNHPNEREEPGYNQAATTHAFANHMMFQAEAVSEGAANGIRDAMPPPTQLNLPPLIGKWLKLPDPRTTDNFPHLVHVQYPDGTVADINQDTGVITMRGRAVAVTPQTILFRNDVTHGTGTFSYEFTETEPPTPRPPGALPQIRLELTRNNNTQVLRQLNQADPLYRFFFQWQRISVTPAGNAPPYFAFFYPDRTLITRRVDNFEVNNRAKVTNITPTQISIHSDTLNNDTVWSYSFSNDLQQMTLEKSDHSVTQVFWRVV